MVLWKLCSMATGIFFLGVAAHAEAGWLSADTPDSGVSSPAISKSVAPSDIVDLRDVHDPQISTDGRMIAFTVERRIGSGKPNTSSIWTVPVDGDAPPKLFVLGDGTDTSPRWSPDNGHIAFLSGRKNPLGDEKAPELSRQIWLIDVAGGEALPLTSVPGSISAFKWSRDGRRIAFTMVDPDTKEERERKEKKQDQIHVDHDYKFNRLWVLDVASRKVRQVSPAGMQISDFDWSPDGTQFVVRANKTPGINDYWYRSTIDILDGRSGKIVRQVFDRAAGTPVRWSPDGRKLFYGEIGEHYIGVTQHIYDLATGKRLKIGDDYRGLILDMEWAADSQTLVAEGFRNTRVVFLKVDAETGALEQFAEGKAIAPLFTMSDNGTIAYLGEAFDQPLDIWVLGKERHAARTNFNPQVRTWKLGDVREIKWRSSKDGKDIYGVLVTPPGYKAGTPTKMVVQIHGGPEWAWWLGWYGSWHEWAQMLALHGYVVFMPNPRGSDGQGNAFAREAYQDWGGGDFQDVMDGIDNLVKQNIADPKRLGIGGWSYGGFMSAWAVTHTDRFKAAIVGAGVVDLTSMALTSDCPDFIPGYFGDPTANHELYDVHSPLRFIDRVKTPVLVLHGEADPRVPISQGEQLYNGLKGLGRPVEMVRYPREPHWFVEKEHQRDILERVLAWYDKYL